MLFWALVIIGIISPYIHGAPPTEENLHSEAFWERDAYIPDTAEVIEARKEHIATVENIRRFLDSAHTTPKVRAYLQAPEYTEETSTPVHKSGVIHGFVIRAPEDVLSQNVDSFRNGEPAYSHTTNERLIVMKLEGEENIKLPAVLSIYLPHIIHNNNPYYKHSAQENVRQNVQNVFINTVTSSVADSVSERNVEKVKEPITAEEHLESFVQNLYNSQTKTGIESPVVKENINSFRVVNTENLGNVVNDHSIQSSIKKEDQHISPADREVEKFAVTLSKKDEHVNLGDHEVEKFAVALAKRFSASVNDIGIASKQDNKEEEKPLQSEEHIETNSKKDENISAADHEVEKFVTKLEERSTTFVKDTETASKQDIKVEERPFHTFEHVEIKRNENEHVSAADKEVEKFVATLEERLTASVNHTEEEGKLISSDDKPLQYIQNISVVKENVENGSKIEILPQQNVNETDLSIAASTSTENVLIGNDETVVSNETSEVRINSSNVISQQDIHTNSSYDYTSEASKAINEIELEKFLARLEEKYKNDTSSVKVEQNVVENPKNDTDVLKNKESNGEEETFLIDQRFAEGKENIDIKKNDSVPLFRTLESLTDLGEGIKVLVNDSRAIIKFVNNTEDAKIAERFVGDILKIVDQQIVKFVNELMSKHDAEVLGKVAKDFITSSKNEDVDKLISGLVDKPIEESPEVKSNVTEIIP